MTSPSRTVANRSLSAWARAYAEKLGWPVFPLRPKAKTPLTAHGFKDATANLRQVDLWWDSEPDANIGLPTGIAFDVFDVDGPDGVAFLAEHLGFVYRHDGPLALTGKGWHLLFAPTGLGNGANLGGTKDRPSRLDFRGKGGYIVAPPSIHPLGHPYEWDAERGPRTPLPQAPAWLVELLERDENPIRQRIELAAPIDPNRPAIDYLALVTEQRFPKDQLPRGLRKRGERPSILDACAKLGLPLRRRANYYQTKCIFHADSTPSMTIYPTDNTFHCFGCDAHGDSYDLLNEPPTHI